MHKNKLFDKVILYIIILSSFKLVLDTYIDPDSDLSKVNTRMIVIRLYGQHYEYYFHYRVFDKVYQYGLLLGLQLISARLVVLARFLHCDNLPDGVCGHQL